MEQLIAFLVEAPLPDEQPLSFTGAALRGLLVLAFGLALVRLAGARLFGKWTPLDIVLAVLVGSTLSRALTGNAPLLQTFAGLAVLVALHSLLVRAALRWRSMAVLIKGEPVELVRDGRVDEAAMRKCGVGPRDLQRALRAHGLTDAGQTRSVVLERSGDVSVVERDG